MTVSKIYKSFAVAAVLTALTAAIDLSPHTANAVEDSSSFLESAELKEIHRLQVDGYINAVAWNADGSRLATLSKFGSVVTLWETAHWTVLHEFKRYSGSYAFNSLAFLPDGSLITSAPNGDYSKDPRYANTPLTDPKYPTLQIFSFIQWNPETGKVVQYIPNMKYPPGDTSWKISDTFAVSKDGSLIAGFITGTELLVYDTKSGLLKERIPIPPSAKHHDTARSVAFSPDGKELAAGTMDGEVYFFNVADGSLAHSFLAFPDELYYCSALSYSANGQLIAAGKNKNIEVPNPSSISTEVFRVRDGSSVAKLEGSTTWSHDEAVPVRTLSWDPANELLAVGDDKSLRVWQVNETKHALVLKKSISHGAFSTSFSPQGLLAASDNDSVVIYQQ